MKAVGYRTAMEKRYYYGKYVMDENTESKADRPLL